MGFRIVKIFLTPGDLQRSKVKVKPSNFEAKYLKNCTRSKVKRSQIGLMHGFSNGRKFFLNLFQDCIQPLGHEMLS